MAETDDPLGRLLKLEGVPSGFAAARDGIDALLRDRGLRRTSPGQTAESLLVGAHASAVLEGSASSLDEVRDGAGDEIAADAVRVSAHLLSLVPVLRTAPLQAFARLHALASGAPDSGRPREAESVARLQALGRLLTAPTTAPALLVAAVVHADLATAAPFPSHNGIVARAAERLVWVARGVDERSVLVPEAGHLALRAAYESNLGAYRDGGPAGVHAWLRYAAEAAARGAEASPLAGRLTPRSAARRQARSARPIEMRRHPSSSKAGAATDTRDRGLPGVHTQLLPREVSRWLAPCRKGRSPRGYPVRVLVIQLLLLSVVRRSGRPYKG